MQQYTLVLNKSHMLKLYFRQEMTQNTLL